jgi:3-methyladenine DNA glycosylase AlkC
MEPLKEMFGPAYYESLSRALVSVHPSLSVAEFMNEATASLGPLSLNHRMRHTSLVMNRFLPADFRKAVAIMKEVVPLLKPGYTNLVFPDYVSVYGAGDFDTSMEALRYFTQFGSSEFAIRTFLAADFKRTIHVMYRWSEDENVHVRRLSSEGSRPRLPWSFKLDEVISNPSVTRPILENLKTDDELYVRKSVANHLNDLTKDSPDYVLKLVAAWDSHPHTAWIIKRGCRSLLKAGDKRSLSLFNFTKNVKIAVKKFSLHPAEVRLNDTLQFQFEVHSASRKVQRLMIDYRIHYAGKNGARGPKVFKLKELELKPGEHRMIMKKQRFQDFTTRKLHSGPHTFELLVNGEVVKRKGFLFRR